MRRLWTESGARRARWWRPRWPPMPRPRWWSSARGSTQVDELIDDLALFTRLRPERFPAWESLAERAQLQRRSRSATGCVLKLLQARRSRRSWSSTSIQSLVAAGARAARRWRGRPARSAWASTMAVEELARWLVENGFHQHHGGGVARRVLASAAASSTSSPRLGRAGAGGVLRRRDRIDPALRDFQPAEPGVAGRGRRDDCRAGALPSRAPSGRLSAAAKLVSAGRADGTGAAGAAVSDVEAAGDGSPEQDLASHRVRTSCSEVFRFPSVTASAVAAGSLETTCRLKIESVERFSGDINQVRDELDEAGAGQEVFVVCQTEAEVRRLRRDLRRHAGRPGGPPALPPRHAAKRFSAGAGADRAVEQRRAVSPHRPAAARRAGG